MSAAPSESAPRRDGWVVAGLALVTYVVLAQRTFYGFDGMLLLWSEQDGLPARGYHSFYRYGFGLVASVLRPLEFTRYEIACAVSAVGTALGVATMHGAARRLGCRRRDAALVALAVAVCPAWVFFATVVEVHGLFLPFAGLALSALIRANRSATRASAAVAGVAVGIAYLAHPTGVVLLALMPWLARSVGRKLGAAFWRHAGIAGVVAAAVMLSASFALATSALGVAPSTTLSMLFTDASGVWKPEQWSDAVLFEWVVPFAPLGVVAPILAGRRFTWLAPVVLGYLLVAVMLCPGYHESGAYLLPLAGPFAVCCLPALRRPLVAVVLLGVSLAIAVVRVEVHDEADAARAYADGLRTIAGENAVILVGHERDVAAHFLYLEDAPIHFLADLMFVDEPARAVEFCREFDRAIDAYFRDGRRVFVSSWTIASLDEAARTGIWRLTDDGFLQRHGSRLGPQRARAHWDSEYDVAPVRSGGFEGVEIRARR